MFKLQLFLYSIVSALLIYQFEPLTAAQGLSQVESLKLLTIVQLVNIFSIYLYSWLMNKFENKNIVIRGSLLLRITISLILFFIPGVSLFKAFFLFYQIFSVGLDIFYETSILEWTRENQYDFGKYRMFGSLGYATSGLFVTIILAIFRNVDYLILIVSVSNIFLLALTFFSPINTKIISPTKEFTKNDSLPIFYHIFIFGCALIITLPNSFGYLLNGFLSEKFSLNLNQSVLFASLAVFLGSCVSEMLGFYVVDDLIVKWKPERVILLGFMMSLFRWVIAVVSPNQFVFISTYLLHGVSFSFIYIGCVLFINQRLHSHPSGLVALKFTLYANIVNVLLAQSYTFILEKTEIQVILIIYILICVIVSSIYVLSVWRENK